MGLRLYRKIGASGLHRCGRLVASGPKIGRQIAVTRDPRCAGLVAMITLAGVPTLGRCASCDRPGHAPNCDGRRGTNAARTTDRGRRRRHHGDRRHYAEQGRDVLLKDEVNSLLQQGQKSILINLGAVSYVDSARLGELVQAYVTTKNKGGTLKLVNVTSG
jgi:STAS domain-containing protein